MKKSSNNPFKTNKKIKLKTKCFVQDSHRKHILKRKKKFLNEQCLEENVNRK